MQMTASCKLFSILILIVSLQTSGFAQTPAGACGGQPLCVEAVDFTATVTSFRTSTVGSSRIINVSVRFQNKTAQPLVLGYVASSGITTDERGNRYIVYGPNGFRGIGLVYGNNFDPRLTLRPAGSGDAQFEMHLQATPQNAGQTFTVDLTIDEINNTGNQPTLGGEFPLHFEGLANGVSQGAGSLAGAPDGLANAVSNLKSIFGKKKAVQNAASIANSAANTAAAVNAAGNSAAAQPPSAAPNTPGQAGSSSTAPQPSASSPSGATASAPAAVSQNLPPQRSGQQAATQQAPAQPQNQSGAAKSATPADLQGAALADPSGPDPNLGTVKVAASAGKYDVLGIKLGMPAKEAMALLKAHGQYQTSPETIKYDFLPAPLTYGVLAANAVVVRQGDGRPGSEKIYLMLTMPPNQPKVTKISRYLMFSKDTAPTAESLVADLIKKYGTPSYDSNLKDLYASPGYRDLYWVDDAQGHRLLNQVGAGGSYSEQINNCRSVSTFSYAFRNIADPGIQVDPVRVKQELEQGYTTQDPGSRYGCANLTMIYANIFYGYPIGVAAHDVAGGLVVMMGSAPLDHTAADATREYLVKAAKNRDLAQKQKAQQNKPVL
jgi:hypothetical protein